MSEAAKKKEAVAEAPAGEKKKGSKLPLILLAVLVLVGGGGAGAWFMLKHKHAGAAAANTPPPPKPHAAALYYKFDPAFVVNFGGTGSARYFQVTVEAMARDQAVLDLLKANEPAVRNDLVLLYSSQTSDTLLSNDGKEKLRSQSLDAIRKVIDEEGSDGKKIEQVYFTSFVIQ